MQVDPNRLREAAQQQADVGSFVSGMGTGQSVASAGTGMPDLLTETACRFASTMFDSAASAVHEELTDHSTKLSAAADHYQRADEEFARRLKTFTQ